VTASGAKADEAFFPSGGSAPRSFDRNNRSKAQAQDVTRRMNALQLASFVDEVVVDRIFNASVGLSSSAIVDFVTQLCKVAEQVCPALGAAALQQTAALWLLRFSSWWLRWLPRFSVLALHGCW
jgi:hypothetical protein